ncbi:MAG: DNA-packaging protein [Henriciella sp.]
MINRINWLQQARPNQIPPRGDWLAWVLLAGRGFGKTRAGAQWLAWEMQNSPDTRWAIVAPTSSDARNTCMEGESGLLNALPEELIEDWKRSYQEMTLTLTNGAIAKCYSAAEPNRLRGPQYHGAWCEELSSWERPEAYDMLLMGLRLGDMPRRVVTSTPKPNVLTRRVISDQRTVISRGSTFDNKANLPASFLDELRGKYEGTRLGRQELYAEILDDVRGALWTWDVIKTAQEQAIPSLKHLRRVIVAVDPSGSDGEAGDSQGIIVAALGLGGRFHVLKDGTMRGSPNEWAQEVVKLYHSFQADLIVAERNFGGAMVESTIQSVAGSSVPVKLVTASRGKSVRAEPIAALYEQGRVGHVEPFPELENQMTAMTTQGYSGEGSPDRLDALVWALTELLGSIGRRPGMPRSIKFISPDGGVSLIRPGRK